MTVAPKARFGQAEGASKRQRASTTAAKALKASKAPSAASPAITTIPSFRTVLIPSVGWPTEDSIPGARKRTAKR